MEQLRQFRTAANRFFLGTPFFVSLMVLTAFVPIFECELQATMVYICLISAILLICDDILTVFFPFLLACVFLTRCYNCYDEFIVYKFWLVPFLVALVLHFCLYRQKISLGETSLGLCLVSVAVTLGAWKSGLGENLMISLYYLIGLGFGMLLLYVLLRSQLKAERPYDVKRRFALIMTLTGVFICVCIVILYIKNWKIWRADTSPRLPEFQSANNLSTLLLMIMPFPAWLSRKDKRWLPLFFLMFTGTLFSISRGGIVMGLAEFAICLLCLAWYDRKNRFKYWGCATAFAIVGICVFALLLGYLYNDTPTPKNAIAMLSKSLQKVKSENRYKTILRLKDDFLSDPLLGRGFFWRGNEDFYRPRMGAMNWSHVWFAQIIGNMGLVGIVAYGYQLIERILVTVRYKSEENWFFFLSYAGLFLMSQVNPGEFCPFPYAALAVVVFILIEEKTLFPKPKKTEKNES